jgi:proteasome lid subunit RPN8/RPN11
MKADVDRLAPEEACGIVAAVDGQSVLVIPIENDLHSPVRFRMKPKQQLDAFLLLEKNHWDMAAIYHSHPQGPDQPSETDLAEHHYPEAVALIWSHQSGEWLCRAFWIASGRGLECQVE